MSHEIRWFDAVTAFGQDVRIGLRSLLRLASSYLDTRTPGVLPAVGAAAVLIAAAVIASLLPATRAARVDVLQVLRSE